MNIPVTRFVKSIRYSGVLGKSIQEAFNTLLRKNGHKNSEFEIGQCDNSLDDFFNGHSLDCSQTFCTDEIDIRCDRISGPVSMKLFKSTVSELHCISAVLDESDGIDCIFLTSPKPFCPSLASHSKYATYIFPRLPYYSDSLVAVLGIQSLLCQVIPYCSSVSSALLPASNIAMGASLRNVVVSLHNFSGNHRCLLLTRHSTSEQCKALGELRAFI